MQGEGGCLCVFAGREGQGEGGVFVCLQVGKGRVKGGWICVCAGQGGGCLCVYVDGLVGYIDDYMYSVLFVNMFVRCMKDLIKYVIN